MDSSKKILGVVSSIFLLYLIKYYYFDYIEYDNYYSLSRLPDLKRQLYENVYGQHIAIENIVKNLNMHYKIPFKALAFSLHGDSGTGKSYVVDKIILTLFRRKEESVHFFNYKDFRITTNYPLNTVKENLFKKINDSITADPESLFVFDRAEKIAPVLLESLIHFLDYSYADRDENLSKPIFIFLSNSGSEVIKTKFYEEYHLKNRTTVTINDIVPDLKMFLYNNKNEYYYSKYIKNNLIEFIPFLPLEREHVRGCLKTFFKSKNINPNEEHLEEALKHIEWDSKKIFAVKGCKDARQAAIWVINHFKLKKKEL